MLGHQAVVAGSASVPAVGEPRAFTLDGTNESVLIGAPFAATAGTTAPAFSMFVCWKPATLSGDQFIVGGTTSTLPAIQLYQSGPHLYAIAGRSDSGRRAFAANVFPDTATEKRLAITFGGTGASEPVIYANGVPATPSIGGTGGARSNTATMSIGRSGAVYDVGRARCALIVRANLSAIQVSAMDALIDAWSIATGAGIASARAALLAAITSYDPAAIAMFVESTDDPAVGFADAIGGGYLAAFNMDATNLVAV